MPKLISTQLKEYKKAWRRASNARRQLKTYRENTKRERTRNNDWYSRHADEVQARRKQRVKDMSPDEYREYRARRNSYHRKWYSENKDWIRAARKDM